MHSYQLQSKSKTFRNGEKPADESYVFIFAVHYDKVHDGDEVIYFANKIYGNMLIDKTRETLEE